MNLSTKQKQFLKGLAHNLKPVVLMGANGLTEAVLAEIEIALNHHELIKVKVATEDRETKVLIVSNRQTTSNRKVGETSYIFANVSSFPCGAITPRIDIGVGETR